MKLRFFVIDDVEGIRLLFREYITAMGHEVVCAEHPMAENVCSKSQCTSEFACADGYFVDLSMPYMTGIEFLENAVKRECKIRPKNNVLMSGYFTQEATDRAEKLGVTLVNKPVNLYNIKGLIEERHNRIDQNRRLSDLPAS